VRGVCRLYAGREGLSDNIRVHSVIGRFLEHSRIYYFLHGGEDLYYIGSADWMHRNLDARVEAITPIFKPALKKYLQYLLNLILRDNRQRWILGSDGLYTRPAKLPKVAEVSTHHQLMKQAKNNLEPTPMV